MEAEPAAVGPLVSGRWLADHRDQVRIVDVRWYLDGRSGLDAYRGGHIPGAVWIDLDRELSGPASAAAGRHPLPTPERFAAALGNAGVGAGQPVVAYDDAGGSVAARLWWMLRVLGEPVAVLDGGLAAWPGRLQTGSVTPRPVPRAALPWPPQRFLDADEIAGHAGAVLDARTAARYAAGDPAVDPRPGHLPGAVSMPWAGNLDERTGRFLDPAQLRDRFATVRGAAPATVVAYCGSGVTACHDLLALEVAGITDSALYTGSWSQWGADPARPAVTGADPGSGPAAHDTEG